MENIRQAIERAKSRNGPFVEQRPAAQPYDSQQTGSGFRADPVVDLQHEEIELSSAYLRSNRIIAHGVTEPLSRPYDMLRTQVLQAMDPKGSRVLAVTSPTPGCGKTVTAVNLALSIARQPERSVLLVDLDLRKPRVAASLGIEFEYGVLSVLEGLTRLSDSVIRARVGNQHLKILPAKFSAGSSELMASRAMTALFQDLKREFRSETIIVDLPPILSSDDVIAVLPQVDCALLVVGVGTSKISEIEECNRHLQTTEIVKIVVNKAPEVKDNYYYY